ncbi:unnamed protein product [Rotaria sordida]|uniref:Uncharacterized protein n=1 Tax=Rotaria sordida TaxID=392033 RepID=A0A814MC49_9BILA|nr:unnamed protein product [Rotaria sordida]
MSTSSTIITRKTRSTCVTSNSMDVSNIFEDFHTNLHSPTQFIHIYNQYYQSQTQRTTLFNILCNILIIENSSLNSNEKNSSVSFANKINDAIFPSLIDCNKPIENLMNLLYDNRCSTSTIDYFYSNNIKTIGDIARLTSAQIEIYPIPSPKLINIQKVFSLYEEQLTKSSSISPPIDNINESLMPIASTSEEINPNNENISTIESSSIPIAMITNQHDKLYDVDTLIDSLDYEKLYLNDKISSPINQTNFLRTRYQKCLIDRQESNSSQKYYLTPINKSNEHEQNDSRSLKTEPISNITLGDRLQKAADIYKTKGILPFDNDYIELIRQLFNNSSLTHLERLHLNTLFLNQ